MRAQLDAIYRTESRRVLATLIRLLGDFDLAEEAMHDAFMAAVERWPRDGIPRNPYSWLVSAGRFRAVDQLRRRATFDASQTAILEHIEQGVSPSDVDEEAVGDDRLRLIFTCCHPALSPDAQLALTLREVCGLTTEEIAHAFLTSAPTIAQRIVRAKAKIRDAGIPYEVPVAGDLPARLAVVLRVVYLVFNQGYSATRADLAGEAIRLGRLLAALLSGAEVLGLLALMLLHDSRRDARVDPNGEPILLADQDRTRWDAAQIAEGVALVDRALALDDAGPYSLQAAIASLHARADADATDWTRIVRLYDELRELDDSPVIALNRAAAVAMRDGPAAGLALVDALLADGALADYQFAHSARADLLRRLGRAEEARAAYDAALRLAGQGPERRFLERMRRSTAPPRG